MSEAKPTEGSASPPRNFTLTVEERLRAVAGGPAAYMRRRRRIEDLTGEILREASDLARARASSTEPAEQIEEQLGWRTFVLRQKVDQLNELIARHNRYFPVEANLPLDPRTGTVLELGRPWQPLEPLTWDEITRRAAAGLSSRDP